MPRPLSTELGGTGRNDGQTTYSASATYAPDTTNYAVQTGGSSFTLDQFKIAARKTAGTGPIEATTLSEVLDFIGGAAQGDLLYRGAATWARLGAGTSGRFLQTQGAGANPVWAAAGAGTVTSVGITAPAAGITVSGSPVTTSGSMTLALANDLAALESLTGTGIPNRTAVDTWSLLTFDTDGTLAANSDTRVATQKAVKTYVTTSVASASVSFASDTRVYGRSAGAGAGAGQELTLTQVLDFIGSAAQGDILYRDAASWSRLPAGTTGYYLKTQGPAANPVWSYALSGAPFPDYVSYTLFGGI